MHDPEALELDVAKKLSQGLECGMYQMDFGHSSVFWVSAVTDVAPLVTSGEADSGEAAQKYVDAINALFAGSWRIFCGQVKGVSMDKLKRKARGAWAVQRKEYFCNWPGLLPFFILFGVFMLYPFLYGVVMSFYRLVRQQRKRGINFVGLSITSLCYQEKASHLKGFDLPEKFVHLCASDLVDPA